MLEGSEFVQVQNNTRTQTKEVVEKNSGMEDASKEPTQHFFFLLLAVPQKPPFSNLADIRIQRNELLRNVTRPFRRKASQTQAAGVTS